MNKLNQIRRNIKMAQMTEMEKVSQESIELGKQLGMEDIMMYLHKRVGLLELLHHGYQADENVEGASEIAARVDELVMVIEELTKDID
jgi:hypothetical protein